MTRPLLVIGGVAGCGKTTLATALAAALDLPLCEGDDLHPPANRAKMAAGQPLDDADRAPWLEACATQLAAWGTGGGVISVSALKRAYRDRLGAAHPAVRHVQINITPGLALARAAARPDHFWPPSLTASQFAILEPPSAQENAICVPAAWSTADQVAAVIAALT